LTPAAVDAKQVTAAMLEFDTNGDGLSYCEMITLLCKSSEFQFQYDDSLMTEVYSQVEAKYGILPSNREILIAARMQAAAATLRSGALEQESTAGRLRSSSSAAALRDSGNYAEMLWDATALFEVPDSEPVRMLAASAALEVAAMGLNTRITAEDAAMRSATMLFGGAVLRARAAEVDSQTTRSQGEAGAMVAAATMMEAGATALQRRIRGKEDTGQAVDVIQAGIAGARDRASCQAALAGLP